MGSISDHARKGDVPAKRTYRVSEIADILGVSNATAYQGWPFPYSPHWFIHTRVKAVLRRVVRYALLAAAAFAALRFSSFANPTMAYESLSPKFS